jgi:hypothetical protein
MKHDRDTGRIKKRQLKEIELLEQLKDKTGQDFSVPYWHFKDIQELAKGQNLPVKIEEPIIEEGSFNKPKGI